MTSSSSSTIPSIPTRDYTAALHNAAPPEWDQLLVACQKNQPAVVEQLIVQQGVSPSHANAIGQSALHVAALWSHVECCRILLQHGANVHAANTITGATPLHACAQSSKASKSSRLQDQWDCIDLLLTLGKANPSMGDFYGSIPMDYVVLDDNGGAALMELLQPTVPIIFQYTMEHSDPSKDNNNIPKLKALVASDASVVHARHLGLTPLLKLVDDICNNNNDDNDLQSIRLQKLEILLQAGADPNHTPTMRRNGHFESVNPEPPAQGSLQRVCHQLAEAYPKKKAKANTNPKDDNDSLTTTISHFQQAAVLLAHHGAVLSLTDSDSTTNSQSLHDAARRNLVEWATFLIETLRVDPNTRGRQGMTPLQFAARSGKVEMVTYLLTLPTIHPALTDDRGQTPLDAAKANQKDDVVRLLETYLLSQTNSKNDNVGN
jgi:ankyrin repeat protein